VVLKRKRVEAARRGIRVCRMWREKSVSSSRIRAVVRNLFLVGG
jgi:hypothetical protein